MTGDGKNETEKGERETSDATVRREPRSVGGLVCVAVSARETEAIANLGESWA